MWEIIKNWQLKIVDLFIIPTHPLKKINNIAIFCFVTKKAVGLFSSAAHGNCWFCKQVVYRFIWKYMIYIILQPKQQQQQQQQ